MRTFLLTIFSSLVLLTASMLVSAQETVDGADQAVENAVDGVDQAVENAVDGVDQAVEDAVDGADQAVESAVDGADQAVEDAVDGADQAVEDAVDGADQAVESAVDGVDQAVNDGQNEYQTNSDNSLPSTLPETASLWYSVLGFGLLSLAFAGLLRIRRSKF